MLSREGVSSRSRVSIPKRDLEVFRPRSMQCVVRRDKVSIPKRDLEVFRHLILGLNLLRLPWRFNP